MENEPIKVLEVNPSPKPPIGFKRLSERYPLFPILLANGVSMMDIKPIAPWRWKLWEIATGWLGKLLEREFSPANKWIIHLVDGRMYPLTDAEQERYFLEVAIHERTMQLMAGMSIAQNSYKSK